MVGFVIVSHSENLAKSVVELTSIMAPNARIAPAGGMDAVLEPALRRYRQPSSLSIPMTGSLSWWIWEALS